ncbi:MAG TPA: hypothetical protein VIH22_09780 [Cyclobacteriaceae bacterium]
MRREIGEVGFLGVWGYKVFRESVRVGQPQDLNANLHALKISAMAGRRINTFS